MGEAISWLLEKWGFIPHSQFPIPHFPSPSRHGRKDAEGVSGMEGVFESPMQAVDQSYHGNGIRNLEVLQSLTDGAPLF
jgi:hypothetical protein